MVPRSSDRLQVRLSLEGETAQSEVIGIVLLTAVIVLLTVMVGGTILASLDTGSEPVTNFKVSVDNSNLTITHHGGTSVPDSEVTVVLRAESTERYSLSSFSPSSCLSCVIFEPGERVTRDHNASGPVRVLIVHDPTNTVLFDQEFDVPTPSKPNQRPNAVITVSSNTPTVGQTVTLDAGGSTDPDGTIAVNEWDLDGDGSYDETGAVVERTFARSGD